MKCRNEGTIPVSKGRPPYKGRREAIKRRKEQLQEKRSKRCRNPQVTTNKKGEDASRKRKGEIKEKRDAKSARRDGINNDLETIWNFGKPSYRCQHCNAILWCEERLNSNKGTKNPSFGICCKQGKIDLPNIADPPPYLAGLLTGEGSDAMNFRESIRSYNSMFSFTSMGGAVDKEINKGKGPYVFRLHGQNYHHIGSLLPEEGNKPRFAQLYIYQTENEVQNRIDASRCNDNKSTVDPRIVEELKKMLDENNILAKSFRMARDRFKEDYHDYTLRILGKRNGTHNLPSASEVAALVVRDPTEESEGRDIVVEYKNMVPHRISEIHPKFMSMQYPLLFPLEKTASSLKSLTREQNRVTSRKYVTMLEYYAYYLQQRPDQGMSLLMSRHLSLQFWVDVYTCIEQNRLNWIRNNQGKLRTELYSGLQDAIERGDTRTEQVGKRIIVPSSFTGGRRHKAQNLQDAFAICRWAGYPDLFITFTCNAKWPEIQYMLDEAGGGLKPADRPDIVDRVFMMIKLKELMRDIMVKKHFGETISIIYTIEFQKRGLPHAHILVFLKEEYKCKGPSEINKIIIAEIPDKDEDPEAYAAVENFMMHGPCGEANTKSPCMIDNRCTKHFPKRYNVDTTIDEDGFPVYRRRDNGRQVKKGKAVLDNRFVVPYNRNLLVKFQAHINVEWCNRSRSIKYLFKYIHKDDDQVTALLKERDAANDNDEIRKYLEMRYISTTEACWRIFQFDLHYRDPPVERLPFHIENEQQVIFPDSTDIENIVRKPGATSTKFTEWMEANKIYEQGKELTYAEFPSKFVWKSDTKTSCFQLLQKWKGPAEFLLLLL